jgi:hypothetical protein
MYICAQLELFIAVNLLIRFRVCKLCNSKSTYIYVTTQITNRKSKHTNAIYTKQAAETKSKTNKHQQIKNNNATLNNGEAIELEQHVYVDQLCVCVNTPQLFENNGETLKILISHLEDMI